MKLRAIVACSCGRRMAKRATRYAGFRSLSRSRQARLESLEPRTLLDGAALTDDLGVFTHGNWLLDRNENLTWDGDGGVLNSGWAGVTPVVGDWDGRSYDDESREEAVDAAVATMWE